jgi:hypothetical protein
MSGELSPDGNYYWDGTRWASAVSPDGAWRWDGAGWRAAATTTSAPGRRAGPLAVLIALAVIAAVVLAGFGLWAGARFIAGEQQNLQSSFAPACTQNGMPGEGLHAGDTVCGRRLGSSLVSTDCSTALPPELVAEHIPAGSSDWAPADIGMDTGGCELLAQKGEIVAVDSADIQPSIVTEVADFVPSDFTGSVGLRVACTEEASCVDIALYPDGTFELDEGVPGSDWKELTSGPMVFSRVRPEVENRLILRFADGVATVYLNGYELTHAKPDIGQHDGYIGFYADNDDSASTEHVQLRRFFVFDS